MLEYQQTSPLTLSQHVLIRLERNHFAPWISLMTATFCAHRLSPFASPCPGPSDRLSCPRRHIFSAHVASYPPSVCLARHRDPFALCHAVGAACPYPLRRHSRERAAALVVAPRHLVLTSYVQHLCRPHHGGGGVYAVYPHPRQRLPASECDFYAFCACACGPRPTRSQRLVRAVTGGGVCVFARDRGRATFSSMRQHRFSSSTARPPLQPPFASPPPNSPSSDHRPPCRA